MSHFFYFIMMYKGSVCCIWDVFMVVANGSSRRHICILATGLSRLECLFTWLWHYVSLIKYLLMSLHVYPNWPEQVSIRKGVLFVIRNCQPYYLLWPLGAVKLIALQKLWTSCFFGLQDIEGLIECLVWFKRKFMVEIFWIFLVK